MRLVELRHQQDKIELRGISSLSTITNSRGHYTLIPRFHVFVVELRQQQDTPYDAKMQMDVRRSNSYKHAYTAKELHYVGQNKYTFWNVHVAFWIVSPTDWRRCTKA